MEDSEEDIIRELYWKKYSKQTHLTSIRWCYQGHWQIVLHAILFIVLIAEMLCLYWFSIGDDLLRNRHFVYLWANPARSMETTNGSSSIPEGLSVRVRKCWISFAFKPRRRLTMIIDWCHMSRSSSFKFLDESMKIDKATNTHGNWIWKGYHSFFLQNCNGHDLD